MYTHPFECPFLLKFVIIPHSSVIVKICFISNQQQKAPRSLSFIYLFIYKRFITIIYENITKNTIGPRRNYHIDKIQRYIDRCRTASNKELDRILSFFAYELKKELKDYYDVNSSIITNQMIIDLP